MNEKRNIEIVSQAYEKFGSGDLDGLIDLLSDDITWETPEVQGSPLGGKRNGRDAVRDFFQTMPTVEDMTAFEPKEFTAQGDKVIVEGSFDATVVSTGRSYRSNWVQIFRLRDEKITSFHEFYDNAAASRAFQHAESA